MEFPTILAILAILGIAIGAIALVVRNMWYVCQPNEVLVFSGKKRGKVGYRIVKGGGSMRTPIFETVHSMDLTNIIIDVAVRNAYSKGGIPLTVQGVANIKVPGEEPLLNNALERFLGRSRDEIMRTARETLEGNLRGVLATLTPEEVNQDKEAFADQLTKEAEVDLARIGLVLDTLKIQNVSDDVGYLDAIGRMRSAAIRQRAQEAEALAQAEAAEIKWKNHAMAELSKLETAIAIARKEAEKRVKDASSRREAMIAEQQAEVQAAIAQARAEVDMQDARIEQTQLQLEADIIRPAEAAAQQAKARAKANAAIIIEQGEATAKVLMDLAAKYRSSGSNGRDVLLMQKLVPVLQQVSSTIGELKVDRLTVIGKGTGGSVESGGGGSLATKLLKTSEEIKAATGVDVPQLLGSKFGSKSSAPASTFGGGPPPTPRRFPAPQE